jgi:ATP synthase protein I
MKKQFNRLHQIKAWVLLPLGFNLLISFSVFLLGNALKAKSCFWGGLVAIVPQAVFGFYCFRFSGAQESRRIWRSFVRGEAIKFLLSVLLFALVYHFVEIDALWFFLAFIMMQILGFLLNCRLLDY